MKSIFLFLITVYSVYAYTNPLNFIINKNNKNVNIKRRNLILTLPLLYIDKVNAAQKEKTIEELREEANNIIEIIESQKISIDTALPVLKNSDTSPKSYDTTNLEINKDLENYINIIFSNFKNKDAISSLNYLKSISTDSNFIKNKDTYKLKQIFDDGKYALLLNKFKKYQISNYLENTLTDEITNEVYKTYEIDVKVFSDYKTMIYNGIQFDDMYYPKENDTETLHYVIYRWIFVKTDKDYKLEGCLILSNKN